MLHFLDICIMMCGFFDRTVSAVDNVKPVTHLLAVDVTSKKGMKLLHEGIRFLVIQILQRILDFSAMPYQIYC